MYPLPFQPLKAPRWHFFQLYTFSKDTKENESVYMIFRHPKLQNKGGRLICLDCATRGPWRELPTFSHFLWYSRRKCKVGENAVLGLSKPELVRNACFYIELVSVTCGRTHTLQEGFYKPLLIKPETTRTQPETTRIQPETSELILIGIY